MSTTDWPTVRFGDAARISHGYAFSGMSEAADVTLPVVVGIGNFDYSGGFRFDSTVLKRYVGGYPSEFMLKPGDLLLAMTCQTPDGEILGIPGRVPDDGVTYLHNQRLGKVDVIDPGRLDLGFVFQLTRWSVFNRHLFVTASGSKILHTSPGRIEDFAFALPPIDEQRRIAVTLTALDDKIQSSHRLADLASALIRASVTQALDTTTACVPVADLARFVNGGAYTKGASGSGRMVIRIAELNKGPGASTVYNDIDVPEDKTARAGDILMSWSGSLGVYRWAREEAIVNQHIFKVIPTDCPDWLVFDRLDTVMAAFQGIAKDKATTMGHIQRGHLTSTTVPIPTRVGISRLDRALGPLWQRVLLAERECLTLERLRDALLPELLSGGIRVADGHRVIEVVA